MNWLLLLAGMLFVLVSQGQTFGDVSDSQAIDVVNPGGIFGNGLSFADFDRDGWDDLSFCLNNGEPIFFKNYSGQFQLLDLGIDFPTDQDAKCILWCDYDNDGDQDLLITYRNSPVRFYNNQGDLQFFDVTAPAGLSEEFVEHYGASFADFDNDGWLDLFLCKYHDEDNDPQYANHLYRNQQDGTFEDVTILAGLDDVHYASFQSAFYDFNKDTYPDLFVINDRILDPNSLYLNNADGTFENVTTSMNVEHFMDAMCVNVGDYDNDMDLDIYISNSEMLGNVLLQDQDGEIYLDLAEDLNLQMFELCWGSLWIDYDNDGWQDLYVTTTDNIGPDFTNPNSFFINTSGSFSNGTPLVGLDNDITTSYAVAMGDFNNDGYAEFAQNNFAPSESRLYQNSGGSNNWLKVSLQGVISNRDGIGSYIHAYVGDEVFTRYTHCGQNYLSQDSHRKIFGLADATMVDSLIVKWPSGHVDILTDVGVNQTVQVVEGFAFAPEILVSGPLCEGDTITLSAGDWNAYNWSNSSEDSSIVVWAPGTYFVNVQNELGLWSSTSFITVQEVQQPFYEISSQDLICFGDSNGIVSIQTSPGDSLSISWAYGETWIADSLSAGSYPFVIVSPEGCMTADTAFVTQPTAISHTVDAEHVTCYNDSDGEAYINAEGGAPPYTFDPSQWMTDLEADEYEFTITDSLGCAVSSTFDITSPDELIAFVDVVDIDEFGGGTAELMISGGTPPYSINWSTGEQDVTFIDGLDAGDFFVTVSDSLGCNHQVNYIITDIFELALHFLQPYPNPFEQDVQLQGEPLPDLVIVFDHTGKEVAAFHSPQKNLHIPHLTSGLYHIVLHWKEKVRTFTLFRQ